MNNARLTQAFQITDLRNRVRTYVWSRDHMNFQADD